MIKPYYQDEGVTQYCSDALSVLAELESGSIDLLATDPPYGISFMGKEWDTFNKIVPMAEFFVPIWAECLRVLKPGAFAFVMCSPRADVMAKQICCLNNAGFLVNFTPIFWAYASGFPKAQNIGKAVDKRLGAEREQIKTSHSDIFGEYEREEIGKGAGTKGMTFPLEHTYKQGKAVTPQAKALEGSYGGFQPKPAVEVIIVAMKPLSEKTFTDQALKNRKGITWLDDCRLPIEKGDEPQGGYGEEVIGFGPFSNKGGVKWKQSPTADLGRFPANLLVSDDVLNDGKITKSSGGSGEASTGTLGDRVYGKYKKAHGTHAGGLGDTGSFSRYFDLDKWWAKTFPFLIVPKASKSEKNKGLDGVETEIGHNRFDICTNCGGYILQNPDRPSACHCEKPVRQHNKIKGNYHPTVKPLKLMSYLVTLGSRVGDTVLDPFLGSGTTSLACKLLNRKGIGIEIEEKYCEIAASRCRQMVMDLRS